MSSIRFLMVGGFLGAGKTTALARLARHYQSIGQRVGIVTNDQAQDLVDTQSLKAQGFSVGEVAGACFCCKFDELMDRVNELKAQNQPAVIMAEPVGSCTDLVATVAQALKDLYGDRFDVAPYAVLFKPSHGLKILKNATDAGFSAKAAYIFRKQLEEADAILLNRCDELDFGQVVELTGLVKQQFPGVPVMPVSAKTGVGFDGLTALLDQKGNFCRRILDIDYDIYAEGEAELGWLNSAVRLSSPTAFPLDPLLLDIVKSLQAKLKAFGSEIAHLKTIGLWEGFFGVANLVSNATAPELSLPSNSTVKDAEVIVNARVAMDPADLENLVTKTLQQCAADRGATCKFQKTQSFRPGRPMPTHRYSAAK